MLKLESVISCIEVKLHIQGGPERLQHLRSMISKKTRDRINKLCPLLHIKFFFQQDDTKIINFDEGVWILWPFFEEISFSKFATSVSKVTTDEPKISIVGSPGKSVCSCFVK